VAAGVAGNDLLAGIMAELDRLSPWFSYAAGDPEGEGWVDVDAVLDDPTIVAGWIDQLLAGAAQGRRDVAGAYLSGWLTGMLVGPVAAAATVEHRAWSLDPRWLAVRRHPDGWFDGLTVGNGSPVTVAGDNDGEGLRRLFDRLADEIVALLTPLFAVIRRHASFGTAGMWGLAADGMADSALNHASRRGTDPLAAWSNAEALIERLAARVPSLRTRPTLAPVEWSGGVAHMTVRGSCCLYHKVSGCDLDPAGEAYCLSCPKRDHDDRLRRWSAGLEPTP
jgi:hypothetical protein